MAANSLMLAHRVFITDRPADLLETAALHEFSIIDTSLCTDNGGNAVAEYIPRAWLDNGLRHDLPALVKLHEDGTAEVRSI